MRTREFAQVGRDLLFKLQPERSRSSLGLSLTLVLLNLPLGLLGHCQLLDFGPTA